MHAFLFLCVSINVFNSARSTTPLKPIKLQMGDTDARGERHAHTRPPSCLTQTHKPQQCPSVAADFVLFTTGAREV